MRIKVLFTLTLACLLSIIGKSQIIDSITYIAKYNFEYKYDTTDKKVVLKETMALAMGNQSSIFFSYDNMLKDSLIEAQIAIATSNGGKTGIDLRGTKQTIPTVFYKNLRSNEFYIVNRIFDKYIMLDTLPKLDWKVKNQLVVFNNLSCNTAICTYKGRYYTALFATEIPYFDGPWKFSGLPGLIVKISDSSNDIVYELIELQARKKFNNTYTTSADGVKAIKTTKTEFKKFLKLREDDLSGFIKTQASSLGISIPSGFAPPKSRSNNPIELTEN
ncbi:MAG: GLPGLI family protein [Flavobacterium sp.]|nr:GLPGLI family protein [Flavobacterium sp.]